MIEVDVRRLSAADVNRLVELQPQRSHRWIERLSTQNSGAYEFFIAWRGTEPVGRAILRADTAYAQIRAALGALPEINALHAEVKNEGIGTQIIAACERHAAHAGSRIGLAVAVGNVDAHRLYARLGYRDWDGGTISAEWDERDDSGSIIATRREDARYLWKSLSEA
ncbi:MAG TPA: GNAT family N-acetyltransferase [Acidimicrobiales bacterium]|nr:GNAT family N-acetyltransferase [Acidimicrobiales bacterium]